MAKTKLSMDITRTMACPKCGKVVMATDQFCSNCFERLEPPSFWRRFLAWFQSAFKPGLHTVVIRKNATFQTIDKQNVKHVYHSLDEAPAEQREAFEKLKSEAAKQLGAERQSVLASGETPKRGIIVRKNTNVFKFKDKSGKEQVYHSIDEMPPDIRAIFEKLRGRIGLD